MAQEPILWVRPGYRPPSRVLPGPDGDPIVEKFPATAPPPEDHPLHGRPVQRWDRMLSNDGNVYSVPWTGAAADYSVDEAKYGRLLKARMRTLGWFPYGACPLKLVVSGELNPRFLSETVRESRPCPPGSHSPGRPCPHTVEEEAFRKARHTRREAKRAVAFKSEADRILEATKEQQAKSAADTTDVVKQLAEMVKGLIGAQWPMTRPNMTAEEFEAELAKRAAETHAKLGAPAAAGDEELAQLMKDADAEAASEEPAPKPPRKGGR